MSDRIDEILSESYFLEDYIERLSLLKDLALDKIPFELKKIGLEIINKYKYKDDVSKYYLIEKLEGRGGFEIYSQIDNFLLVSCELIEAYKIFVFSTMGEDSKCGMQICNTHQLEDIIRTIICRYEESVKWRDKLIKLLTSPSRYNIINSRNGFSFQLKYTEYKKGQFLDKETIILLDGSLVKGEKTICSYNLKTYDSFSFYRFIEDIFLIEDVLNLKSLQ